MKPTPPPPLTLKSVHKYLNSIITAAKLLNYSTKIKTFTTSQIFTIEGFKNRIGLELILLFNEQKELINTEMREIEQKQRVFYATKPSEVKIKYKDIILTETNINPNDQFKIFYNFILQAL